VLIQNVQRPEDFSVVGSVMDKIIRPDVVTVLWPQPYAGSVVQPEAAFLRLFHWDFQPLTPPQTFNALVINLPAGISQQSCDPAIPISTILSDQFDHVRYKAIFIFAAPWSSSLRGSVLAKYATDTTFRQVQFAAHMINADTATRGA